VMPVTSIRFAGLTFRLCRWDEMINLPPFAIIVTVNAEFIAIAHKNPRFMSIINSNFATIDGQIPFFFARVLARPKNTHLEKISGSDLTLKLLENSKASGKKIFFLGAAEESNAKAVEVARTKYGATAAGYSPPLATYPFQLDWILQCRDQIAEYAPHYLFVAFGAPKQEFWMDDESGWLREIGVEICIGCGGSIDFISGAVRRAPVIIQRMGLEGLYRTFKDPSFTRIKKLCRSFKALLHVCK
jgi:N-acetylglucosaminyldiphosphoundecaprenol N-acetyl-beta-D-mannosaminyltransferase